MFRELRETRESPAGGSQKQETYREAVCFGLGDLKQETSPNLFWCFVLCLGILYPQGDLKQEIYPKAALCCTASGAVATASWNNMYIHMCIYICICIHIYIYIYICIHLSLSLYLSIYIIYIYIYIHTYIHV